MQTKDFLAPLHRNSWRSIRKLVKSCDSEFIADFRSRAARRRAAVYHKYDSRRCNRIKTPLHFFSGLFSRDGAAYEISRRICQVRMTQKSASSNIMKFAGTSLAQLRGS